MRIMVRDISICRFRDIYPNTLFTKSLVLEKINTFDAVIPTLSKIVRGAWQRNDVLRIERQVQASIHGSVGSGPYFNW